MVNMWTMPSAHLVVRNMRELSLELVGFERFQTVPKPSELRPNHELPFLFQGNFEEPYESIKGTRLPGDFTVAETHAEQTNARMLSDGKS